MVRMIPKRFIEFPLRFAITFLKLEANDQFYKSQTASNGALKPYLDAVRATLIAATCLRNFPSQNVERHNKPEVEVR